MCLLGESGRENGRSISEVGCLHCVGAYLTIICDPDSINI